MPATASALTRIGGIRPGTCAVVITMLWRTTWVRELREEGRLLLVGEGAGVAALAGRRA